MQEDGFTWWRRRFEQMSEYFDAFRIDHILGFFRIWSIPLHAVEGIMGKFVPAIPIHVNELYERAISFQYNRFCKPYIPDYIVNERFGAEANYVKDNFLFWSEGSFQLKPEFDTQRKVEQYFNHQPKSTLFDVIKSGLFDLISNVIFFEEEGSGMQQLHFRINMDQTTSFRDLDNHSKQKLKELYVNYFFERQDDFWKKEAMNKLPELKSSTNMLVCGEDLGMVPACVPEAMRQLGVLSLEIQRMPKDPKTEFFHPADAPYLSVVTPSTHDMSTIRGWWEEDPAKTQRFYNSILGHAGANPFYCEAYINKEIVIQHLYSPAMWSVFQLQDILGSDETLRRGNPNDERINIPADPKHYWRYRMHILLEDLLNQTAFNTTLHSDIRASGR
jgi:4-alpha-glucanotransferase